MDLYTLLFFILSVQKSNNPLKPDFKRAMPKNSTEKNSLKACNTFI